MPDLDPTIVISGTDPTNPRTAAHIIARLNQIAADTAAMYTEAGRLATYAGSIRDVLLDQGKSLRAANQATAESVALTRAVRERLNATHAAAEQAAAAIRDTGVNLNTRFVWAPR